MRITTLSTVSKKPLRAQEENGTNCVCGLRVWPRDVLEPATPSRDHTRRLHEPLEPGKFVPRAAAGFVRGTLFLGRTLNAPRWSAAFDLVPGRRYGPLRITTDFVSV